MPENIKETVYSDEEIALLTKMQETLRDFYNTASRMAAINESKEATTPEMATAVNGMRAAAGSCAAGYATVTQVLKLAKG